MRAVKLVAASMASAQFDPERLEASAAGGWTTLTELADTLVREHRIPFRTAHAIAARVMAARHEHPDEPLAGLVADISSDVLGAPLEYSEARIDEILSPRHFVSVRCTHGGPAPEQTTGALARSSAALDADERWLRSTSDALDAAGHRLAERAARL
jgi:argininosuccinate lyase